jgi:hypothetical protein
MIVRFEKKNELPWNVFLPFLSVIFQDAVSCLGNVASVVYRKMSRGNGRMNVTGDNQSARRQSYAFSTFSTTNPIRTGTGIELESLWWQACLNHGTSLTLPPRLTVPPSANSSHVTSLLILSYCKLLHFRISFSTTMTQLVVCSNLKIIFPANPKYSSYPLPCVSVLPVCLL